MINFENGALTTDATLSVADSQAIFQFADYCVQMEQERIIKLLEPLTICEDDCDHYDCGTWALKQGIALIKGENQ